MSTTISPLTAELDAALQWWKMAGVDCDFADDATDWLAEPNAVEAPQPQKYDSTDVSTDRCTDQATAKSNPKNRVKRIDFFGDKTPQDIAEFQQWWLAAPVLDAIGTRGRIAPRGPSNPEIMILVVDPEQHDSDHLMSGARGKLLSAMLTAMGVSEEKAYIASALPRHTPMADTDNLAAAGMDIVTLRHIELVSPQRLIALGTGILPLIGQDVSKTDTYLREINQNTQKVPVLVSEGLDSLIAMPRLKARFWRRWIEWTAE